MMIVAYCCDSRW